MLVTYPKPDFNRTMMLCICILTLLLGVFGIDYYLYSSVLHNLLEESNVYTHASIHILCYTSMIYLFFWVREGNFKAFSFKSIQCFIRGSDNDLIRFGNLHHTWCIRIYIATCILYYVLFYYYRNLEENYIKLCVESYIMIHTYLSIFCAILCFSVPEKKFSYETLYKLHNLDEEIKEEIIMETRDTSITELIEKHNRKMYSVIEIPQKMKNFFEKHRNDEMNYANEVFENSDKSRSGTKVLAHRVINNSYENMSNTEDHAVIFDNGVRKNADKNSIHLQKSSGSILEMRNFLTKSERENLFRNSIEIYSFQKNNSNKRSTSPLSRNVFRI